MSTHARETIESMRLLLALWDEILGRGTVVSLRTRGSSMWPAAPDHSVLSVTPCASSALRRGDLVTFRRGEQVITHRVVRVHPDGSLTTWGDSVLRPDPRVPAVDVLGRTEVCERASALGRGFRRGVALRWVLASLRRVRVATR